MAEAKSSNGRKAPDDSLHSLSSSPDRHHSDNEPSGPLPDSADMFFSSAQTDQPLEKSDIERVGPHSEPLAQPSAKGNSPREPEGPIPESPDEPLCRICLSGRDDDDPSLGRFIQPCLCRGTMAFIHVGCLQRWRKSSPSPRSFYRCDQCGYRYKLRRAKVAGLAENTAILGGVTCAIFFILVMLSGFVAGWVLESYAHREFVRDEGWSGISLGPFSYDSTGNMIGEVVEQAVQVLNSKLHVKGGGTRPVKRPTKKKLIAEDLVNELEPIVESDAPGEAKNSYRYVKPKVNSRTASAKEDYPSSWLRPFGKSKEFVEGVKLATLEKMKQLAQHAVKGLAFIGVMSFFQLAISISFFSPWNFGLRNSILRIMHGTNQSGNNLRSPSPSNGLMILIFVALGLFKAIQTVWRVVRKSSQWVLRKIEDGVLDVRSPT